MKTSNIEIFLASNPSFFRVFATCNFAECIDAEGRAVRIDAKDLQNVRIEVIDC